MGHSLGRMSQDSSMAWSDYLESPTEENRRKAETIDQLITQFRGNNGETLADDGTLTLISQDFANYLPQLVDQIKYEAAGALVALPTAVIPGVGAKGIKAAVVAASGIYAYKNMQGAAFKSLLEAGVDEETAKNAANNEALISSIIEMADTAISLALTGGGKAIDALSGGTVSTLKSQVTKLVGKNRATRFMTGLLKYLTNIISEGLEEATQESVSIANEEDPHVGKLELAKNAWGVFLDTVTNEDSENRDRVMEAFGGGARLAMLMGGVEMGGSAAVTNAVTNYQVGKIYGQDPQALIQEAQEINPNSALAKKLQESLDNGKKISGRDLKRLVMENEKAIANMDSSSVESGAEQQPNDAGSPRRNGWRNAAELARQEDLNVMDALNREGLSGSVDLARANPQSYAQSFREALKNGASYDQALMRATADAAMKVAGKQVPIDTLLNNIGGDPKKAVSAIEGALEQAGIRMTPGELNWLRLVAAEASILQEDATFQQKVAVEMLDGRTKEEAWTAASQKLWQEAADKVIALEITDFAFMQNIDQGRSVEAVDTGAASGYNEGNLQEPDIEIGRSLSAKAKNHDVLDLDTGEVYNFAEGTKIQNVKVFAGKGTKKEFRTAQKYANKYGGRPEDWQHAKGFGLLATPDGDREAEVHWVQCPGIGQFEFF